MDALNFPDVRVAKFETLCMGSPRWPLNVFFGLRTIIVMHG